MQMRYGSRFFALTAILLATSLFFQSVALGQTVPRIIDGDLVVIPEPPVTTQAVAPRTDFSKRVGIVYSQTTANRFFDAFAYSQLFMAAQHQAMMAGVPYKLLTENDLTNINNLINLDVIVFPYFAQVSQAQVAAIQSTLLSAVNDYHIGLITSGEFMTANEVGAGLVDGFTRMQQLFGVTIGPSPKGTFFYGGVPITVKATTVSHPAMKGYASDETIISYPSIYFPNIVGYGSTTVTTLARSIITGNTDVPNAMIATQTVTGGRNVYFANEQIMMDTNLLWQAIQWSVYGDQTPVALKLGRQKSIFVQRVDMDQTGDPNDLSTVGEPFYQRLLDWKNQFNFVASLFVNVGPTLSSTAGLDTWTNMHKQYLALGNEIGTHSWTHPDNTAFLSASQLEAEFNQSKNIIGQKVGVPVIGAAIPGNPETLSVDQQLSQYLSYISGRYSNQGSGYPGAFGHLTPAYQSQYFSLNMLPDFTLIGFQHLTPAVAEQTWKDQYTALNKHASQPIVHHLIHDYAPTSDVSLYTQALFNNTYSFVYADGAEFATTGDIFDRIKTFESAGITTSQAGDVITANVASSNAGRFSIKPNTTKILQSVDGWYAYNQNSVFVPRNGGSFVMRLGATQNNVTRISSLPMRAELVSVTGDGVNLSFTFVGAGSAKAELNIPVGGPLTVTGADSFSRVGNTLTMNFLVNGSHTVQILNQASNNLPSVNLTSPTNGATYYIGDSVPLAANATDTDGTITKVEFFNGATKLGEDISAPYTFNWVPSATGTVTLTARATDNNGGVGTSVSPVSIVINAIPELSATSIASEDGYVTELSENSNTGGTADAISGNASSIRIGDNFARYQYKSFLSFDTSALPDTANILSITLQMTRGSLVGTNPFTTHGTAYVDIINGAFSGSNSLQAADFQASAGATQVGVITDQGSVNGSSYTVPLNATALNFVNKVGRTQLRLYFSLDDDNDIYSDYAGFYAANTTNVAYRPKLIVKYK